MQEPRGLVLVVEDEPSIADVIRRYLVADGFGVHVESDGTTGLAAVTRLRPTVVLLDVGLPGLDGIEVCRSLRESGDWTPVLFVTARDDEVDRVLGLELGADDYVTKPFSPRELVARVRAILRRADGRPSAGMLTAGTTRLDPARRVVTVDAVPVPLTTTEFNLLEALLQAPGHVLSRTELLSRAWGRPTTPGAGPSTCTSPSCAPSSGTRARSRRCGHRLPGACVMALPPGSITSRLVLAMILVAAVATGATGLLAAPLLHGATEDAARAPLARQTELLAQLPNTEALVRRVERRTDVQDLTLGIVTSAGRTRGAALALSASQVSALLAGDPVSTSSDLAGVPVLVEARPTKRGGAVVLAASAESVDDAATALRRRILLALGLGLLIALTAAVVVGTRLARPLTRTADVARRMAAGERGIPLPAVSTREVGDVVHALGSLDSALTTSESRQREFLLSVSHELRTPLTAVRGLAEGLADGTIPPEESGAVGRTIVSESQRLEGYIADLLALARLEADDFTLDHTRMDLTALVQEAGVVWAERGRAAGIDVRLEIPGAPLWLESDPARVRQVLDALADNAVRVCPPGSVVVLAAVDSGPAVVLGLRDSGPGLTDDDLAHAFEPGVLHARYATTRAGGQGLGLALVDRLVTRLGGTIEASRAAEGGAAFVVRLPRGRPGAGAV